MMSNFRAMERLTLSTANLDLALMNLLKTFFPVEIRVKQRDNERSSMVDKYGRDYERCELM